MQGYEARVAFVNRGLKRRELRRRAEGPILLSSSSGLVSKAHDKNGAAERWVGSCRCDPLDHVTILNERYLKRLMSEYIQHYYEDPAPP